MEQEKPQELDNRAGRPLTPPPVFTSPLHKSLYLAPKKPLSKTIPHAKQQHRFAMGGAGGGREGGRSPGAGGGIGAVGSIHKGFWT